MIKKDYLYQLNEIIKKDDLDLTIIGRFRKADTSKTKSYLIKCNKCGFDSKKIVYKKGREYSYSIEESNLKNLLHCPCCNYKIVQVGINDIPTTAPWMVEYFQGGYDEAKRYSKSSTQRLFFKCPICNQIKHNKIPIQQLYKKGKLSCMCNNEMSMPEKILYYLLIQDDEISKNFIYQYSPKQNYYFLNNQKKRAIYDFYFKNHFGDFIIETDGNFHYEKYYQGRTLEQQKEIDNQKDILALKNNITPIRINCKNTDFDSIKNSILNSKLNNILDLSKINWKFIQENCYKSIVKLICLDYKNNSLSTKELSKKYHMGRTSVTSYLHIGNKNGWCEYYGGNKKRVYQYTLDGNFVKVWDSCNEAMRQTGITTINYCLRHSKKAGNFYWSYEKRGDIL